MTDKPERDENGRLLPGNTGNPKGRATRAREREILQAIRDALPPETIKQKIETALRLAEEQNSARGILAVLEFCAAYTLGKPKQLIETGKKTPFELLAPQYGLLPADSEDEEEDTNE